MKKALIPIVSATLLAFVSVAAEAGSRGPCASGEHRTAGLPGPGPVIGSLTPGHAGGAGSECVRGVPVQFVSGNQQFLSDKELERALKRQLRGRLIDARLNAQRVEYTVLWEEQQAGKRKLRKLIVDAKTGRVKREIRGSS